MKTFEQDLQNAIAYHGHLCAGQITGVRMARAALRLLGIDDPEGFRDLIVYVECDRCLTDAIGTVTGCKLGKRNLKWMDYGKSAATFWNTRTDEAVRLYNISKKFPSDGGDPVAHFNAVPDEEMFRVTRVKVRHKPEDLPGRPRGSVRCASCGEDITDGRYADRDGETVCKACNGDPYYEIVSEE